MAVAFGNLYDYQLKNGIVAPQVSTVKTQVENAFKELFGGDFSVEPETPQGRMIEAITLLFADVLRVNALNANSFNLNQAVGAYLDNLGAMFGISRQTGETDYGYRNRILKSASRGSGFASSIRNEIGEVIVQEATSSAEAVYVGSNNVVVLDNGLEDPQMLPRSEDGSSFPHSISVAPHSVFIGVLAPDGIEGLDGRLAIAIRNSKSAGCGYSTDVGGGTKQTVYIDDHGSETSAQAASFVAMFIKPQRLYVQLTVTVIDSAYTGDDVVTDTKNAVLALFASRHICDTITKAEVAAAIASAGKGIVCTAVLIRVRDSESEPWVDDDKVIIPPYKYVNLVTGDITVAVNNVLS